MTRWLRPLIGITLAAATCAAPASAQDALQRVITAKVLKVAVAQNAPWVIKQADGTYTGNDIDLVDALAQDMGVTPTYVEMPFDQLVDAVANRKADMAVAGLAITPERALKVAFSAPTGLQEIDTVADRAALGTEPLKAMADSKLKVAVLADSTDEDAARSAYPKATIVTFPSAAGALSSVIEGETQAMVATAPVPRMAASLYDAKLRLVGGPLRRTAEAFVLNPADTRLLTYVDNWIAARRADGFIDGVGTHWFDGQAWLRSVEGDARKQSAP